MNVKGSWKNCTLISQGQFPFKKKKKFQRALQMCKLTKKWPLLATWSTRTQAFISQEENIPENSANIHCSLENFLLWKKKKVIVQKDTRTMASGELPQSVWKVLT